MTRTHSLYGTSEIVIESEGGDEPAELLAGRGLKRLLADHGAVLLRGFRHDVDRFSDLVQQCSSRVTLDPARRFTGRHTQLVDAGRDAMGLHLENGNAPFLPDVIWFYCEITARRGSQTTLCDGEAALEALPPVTVRALCARRIRYERTVPEGKWQRYVSHELGLAGGPEAVGPQHLERIERMAPGVSFELGRNNTLTYRLETDAIRTGRISGRPAFANSLLGPSYGYEHPVITFADGEPLPATIWREIEAATERVTQEIDWRDGDIAVIDNTRYMHGRRRIEDPARVIHNAQSYL